MNNTRSMPNLPGYMDNTPTSHSRSTYGKRQNFKKVHGAMVEVDSRRSLKSLADTSSAKSFISKDDFANSFDPSKSQPLLPTKPVLSFTAYFTEVVPESPVEEIRIRPCTILYYVENETMQVTEHKRENSGIPQGTFVKRHKFPVGGDPDKFLTIDDLGVGKSIVVYGREFHIIDCNKETAFFLEDEYGRTQAEAIPLPDDAYDQLRQSQMALETGADPDVVRNLCKNPMNKFMEASLGNTVRNQGREGFENFSRTVLRFYCQWEDTRMFGEKHGYKLHYFLSDDTIEVLEMQVPNSGRDPFPKLLERCKLPKDMEAVRNSDNGRGVEDEQADDLMYFTYTDLKIGSAIMIYGREVTLLDADEFTRSYYESKGIPLGAAVELPKDEGQKVIQPIPLYVPNSLASFGSEEDSLASCLNLTAKPPKKRFSKKVERDTVLRFSAKYISDVPTDKERRFTICYFTRTDEITVREPPIKNSGVIGGMFLKRGVFKDPATGKPYKKADFHAGAMVDLGGHLFDIYAVDEFSLKFMEENAQEFPFADIGFVMETLRKNLRLHAKGEVLRDAFLAADTDRQGTLDYDEFVRLLRTIGIDKKSVPDQAMITVMRHFDENGDGFLTFNEFHEALMISTERKYDQAHEWTSLSAHQ